MKKAFVSSAFILVFLFAAPAWAGNAQITPPDTVVSHTIHNVLTSIRQHEKQLKNNPDAVYKLVKEQLAPHFAFTYAARLVLGRYWRDATKAQREAFIDAFTHYIVNSYAEQLVEYADEVKIKVQPFRGSPSDRRADIGSTIKPAHHDPIRINYALVRTDEGWKVFDVRASGVSFVMSYRTTFQQEIRQSSLEALIEELQQKARAEKAGAKSDATPEQKRAES